jgi:hypothetical protein
MSRSPEAAICEERDRLLEKISTTIGAHAEAVRKLTEASDSGDHGRFGVERKDAEAKRDAARAAIREYEDHRRKHGC